MKLFASGGGSTVNGDGYIEFSTKDVYYYEGFFSEVSNSKFVMWM